VHSHGHGTLENGGSNLGMSDSPRSSCIRVYNPLTALFQVKALKVVCAGACKQVNNRNESAFAAGLLLGGWNHSQIQTHGTHSIAGKEGASGEREGYLRLKFLPSVFLDKGMFVQNVQGFAMEGASPIDLAQHLFCA